MSIEKLLKEEMMKRNMSKEEAIKLIVSRCKVVFPNASKEDLKKLVWHVYETISCA